MDLLLCFTFISSHSCTNPRLSVDLYKLTKYTDQYKSNECEPVTIVSLQTNLPLNIVSGVFPAGISNFTAKINITPSHFFPVTTRRFPEVFTSSQAEKGRIKAAQRLQKIHLTQCLVCAELLMARKERLTRCITSYLRMQNGRR